MTDQNETREADIRKMLANNFADVPGLQSMDFEQASMAFILHTIANHITDLKQTKVVYWAEYSEKIDSEFDPWVSSYDPYQTIDAAKQAQDTVSEWYETTMTQFPNYRCWMGDSGGNVIWRIVEVPAKS